MTRPRTIEDEQILEITRRVLRERGLQVSTRAIAAEVGMSEGVLFQRFGSKEGLVRAALTLPEIDVEQVMSEAATGTDARDILENIAVAIFATFRDVIPLYIPLIPQPVFGREGLFESRDSPFTMFLATLERHLTEERHEGRIWTESPHRASFLIVSLLHNAALMEAVNGSSADVNEGNIRDLIGIVWQGLQPRK